MTEAICAPIGTHRSQRLARKRQLVAHYDRLALQREAWIARSHSFYRDEWQYMRFVVPEGLRVLEIGCGTGQLLAAVKPAVGVGVDISPEMIKVARAQFPQLRFVAGDIEEPETLAAVGGPFDVIILSDVIGSLEDCQAALDQLHPIATAATRIVITYFNQLWRPLLWLAEALHRRMPHPPLNWLSVPDLYGILELADFEPIRTGCDS